jgi:hypothetical protein
MERRRGGEEAAWSGTDLRTIDERQKREGLKGREEKESKKERRKMKMKVSE